MADNTTLPSASGGDVIRDIDRGTAKTQVIALDLGGEAGPEALVSGSVPVTDTATALLTQLVELAKLQLAVSRSINMYLSQISNTYIDPKEFMDESTLQ